jgi:hypothetical protein
MSVFVPVHPPRNPDECAGWLYEAIMRLNRAMGSQFQSTAAVVRGEVPDGSGLPLSQDLTGYFLLAGRSGGQIGYGGTAASDTLKLASTSSTTKGFIHLGWPNARLTVDEVLKTVGINKTAPTSTLHIVQSDQGVGSLLFTAADIDTTGTRWVARTGSGGSGSGSTLAAALANDDGLTTYGSINTASSGNNPQRCTLTGTITPGATYVVTAKITTLFVAPVYGGGNQNFWDVALIDSNGDEWLSNESGGSLGGASFTEITAINTFVTITRTVVCSGTPHSTGNTPNSINLVAGAQISHAGGGDLYIATTYVTVGQSGSPLMRWDFATGTQSGGINIFGRLGINTGSADVAAEVHVKGTSAALPALLLVSAASQTADIVQVTNSAGKILASVSSEGTLVGNTAQVFYDDEIVSWENDAVYYSPLNP